MEIKFAATIENIQEGVNTTIERHKVSFDGFVLNTN